MKPEAPREMREEHDRLKRRLARLELATSNTPPRRQARNIRAEIEMLKTEIAALSKRYRFD